MMSSILPIYAELVEHIEVLTRSRPSLFMMATMDYFGVLEIKVGVNSSLA